MADASTVALNLVFLGTLVLGLLLFMARISVVLLAAGAGRLAALLVSGLARWARNNRFPAVPPGPQRPTLTRARSAPVAQPEEQGTFNPRVVGSNPTGCTAATASDMGTAASVGGTPPSRTDQGTFLLRAQRRHRSHRQ